MSNNAHDQPKFWNVWWTLTLISAAITILAGILEILGVWHDVGLGVGVIGLTFTILFGATSATKTAAKQIGQQLSQMHDTLSHSLKVQNAILDLLERRDG